ncbi:hypothetical protein HPB52_022743 [Rhipicephalus sanguineus]|uniref:RNase H type-1 domain-containing protein n=1 Tax=Rhipicephalus sanguineus TaxID=34632 RepID=A0A9D4T6I3_RHISA|nr:hypothetical protein HPB52_022743 [Rhipicephalus sanguineus]
MATTLDDRSVLLALTGAFKTARTAALQILMHAAAIDLKLRRLNQEFKLFQLRRPIPWEKQALSPANTALPLDRRLEGWLCIAASMCARTGHTRPCLRGPHTSYLAPAQREAVGRFRVHGAISAHCMELIAFAEALQYLCSKRSRPPAYIYTACLSLLQALASPHCLDPLIENMSVCVAEVSGCRPLHFFHVQGHRGIFGNELADFLATRACRIGPPRTSPQSAHVLMARLRTPGQASPDDMLDWPSHMTGWMEGEMQTSRSGPTPVTAGIQEEQAGSRESRSSDL